MLFAVASAPLGLLVPHAAPRGRVVRMEAAAAAAETDEAFGASHTSFYTDAVAQDSYPMLEEILDAKLADKELTKVVKTMFDACGTITEALPSTAKWHKGPFSFQHADIQNIFGPQNNQKKQLDVQNKI